jgi:putative Holliday junction resolvase
LLPGTFIVARKIIEMNNRVFIGIDYGRARIGVAISESGKIARPLCVVPNKGPRKTMAAFHNIMGSMRDILPHIVIGLPLVGDGREGTLCPEVREFGALLEAEFGVKPVYQNEFMTSRAAEEYIRAGSGKDLVDAVAAAMILQEYLDAAPR